MKIKFVRLLVGSMIAAVVMTSCLKNEDTEVIYNNESAITAFSLGTLKVKVADSTYTIDGSKYHFSIDQNNRLIQNSDSLPMGTDISKVVTQITASTSYIYYKPVNANGTSRNDTIWTNTDSLNFSAKGELEFRVITQSGLVGYPYKVKINVHKEDPELLVWHEMTATVPAPVSPVAPSIDGAASTPITMVSVPLLGNPNIQRLVAMQQNPEGTNARIYQRLSKDSEWMDLSYTSGATASCPNFENVKLIYYDGKLLAFGGQAGALAPFVVIYESKDYGLTWSKSNLQLPTSRLQNLYAKHQGQFTVVVNDDNYIQIYWPDGTVNYGRINRLGYLSAN